MSPEPSRQPSSGTSAASAERLVEPNQPASLRVERRRFPRYDADWSVTAYYADPSDHVGIVRLDIRDTSLGGIGAEVPMRLPTGTRLSISGSGISQAARRGVVVRCESKHGAHHIGIALVDQPA